MTSGPSDTLDVLGAGEIRPLGRIVESSNGAVLVEVTGGEDRILAIHKPIAFERPLWDYPDGHHALRERAAYLLSEWGAFGIVPPTVMREGPWGPGSLQAWVGGVDSDPQALVAVCEPGEEPAGWLVVLRGQDQRGHEVVLAHADHPGLRTTAVLDAVLNNSDRKGGHLVAIDGRVHGFDHGVSLGVEPKLRSVLWGWAGQEIPEADLARLDRLAVVLGHEAAAELADLLTEPERDALVERVARLRREGRHPLPRRDWPAIPWPAI